MRVIICQDQNGCPVVCVEGDATDNPKDVAKAYKEVVKELKEDK